MTAKTPSLRLLAILITLMSFAATSASAQLVITIDTTAQELTLSGSTTTGTPSDIGFGRVTWGFNGGYNGSDPLIRLSGPTTYLSSSGSSPIQIDLTSDGSRLSLDVLLNNATSTFLTGTSVTFDYSGGNVNTIAGLEGGIGETLTLETGTGFDNVSIVAAVPEPSTYTAIFGGLAIVGTLIARRRKRTAA